MTAFLATIATSILVSGCGGGGSSTMPDLKMCANRGSPVTLAKLVDVFRANAITLDINERECDSSLRVSEATNFGPSGVDKKEEVSRREGDILCSVDFSSVGREVRVTKYEGDEETYVDVLNVNCSLYPYDAGRERKQVEQLRRAMEALVDATP